MSKRASEMGKFMRAKTGVGDIDLDMPSSAEMEKAMAQRPDKTAVNVDGPGVPHREGTKQELKKLLPKKRTPAPKKSAAEAEDDFNRSRRSYLKSPTLDYDDD